MSYPRYPAYKASGVEWLGEIPAHWQVRRLKSIASVRLSNVDKKTLEGQEPVDLCNYVDVYYHDKITAALDFMAATATPQQIERFRLKEGDVLITKDSESWTDIAVPAVVTEKLETVLCGYHLALIRPLVELSGRFLARAFSAVGPRDQFQIAANGITRFGLSSDAIMTGVFAVPPFPEQQAIAAFLDRKTGELDALIAEKQRLLALLQEQRAALITQAVTKGLDPSAPMKDSGVELYPSFPLMWCMTRLGDLCRTVLDGPHFSPDYVDDGILFLSTRNVKVDRWSLGDAKFISESDYQEFCKRVVPEIGDVLYTKGGTTGIARVVDIEQPFHVWVHIAVLKLRRELVSPHFLAHSLNSAPCYGQSQLFTRGATNNDLGLNRMVNIVLALPPMEEQLRIVEHIENEVGQIDTLADEVRAGLDHLQEYRTALISAAVTGQIDVRAA
jgi:type I restriction enzyme S subunit